MPVRIYDIAKKLGVESKVVLVKAKELGIAAAKVPSSSLDKITAEFLEESLGGVKKPEPPPPTAEKALVVISEPPPSPASADIPAPVEAKTPPAPAPLAPPPAPVVPLAPPTPPPPPPGPQRGDLVGRINLPTRPAPRAPEPRPASGARLPGSPGRSLGNDRRPAPGGRGFTRADQPPAKPPAPPKPVQPKVVTPVDAPVISIKPPIIVRDLAEKMNVKPFKLIADLMELGVFANVNQALDELIAQRVAAKHGFRFEAEKRDRGGGTVHAPIKKVEADVIQDKPEHLKTRPPVVTIMGHVDHGKTTLLDTIRKASVAAGEAGGITQHIGAYTITVPHPEKKGELAPITFLDTPGHAAFSAMRARGANVTDIVVLVVAANDGVMPQTLEALSHAQAAKVPIIVAVNKCDHPNANAMKVRQQLQEKGLVPDEWGGNTIFVDCSGLTKLGVDKLLEMIVFQADLQELKANPDRKAIGNVIESGLEPGGPTATVLVRKGTLRLSDIILCGQFYGRVRALINEEGQRLKEASPSVAVKVLGLNGVPEAGLEFTVIESEKDARQITGERQQEARLAAQEERRPKVTLENLFTTLAAGQSKSLKIVVKADMQGSEEAIVEALKKIESDKVTLDVIHAGVGTITESDVLLASASKAIVLGFHTRIDVGVSDVAKREAVQIKLYSIIYELIDEVKESMAGLLEPDAKETIIGSAEVRQVFELSKGGNVAGCIVNNGRITRGKVRVSRRKSLLYEGAITSLRRFQDEASEVRSGLECGIRIDGFNEFQVGDTIESFTIEKVAAKL
ncbi:MAG: translation initiation factor IF-2 [Verrucomicrobia bacterium]|nr:translation initiation factor IF-2 [Verrucomicrobiota bacterium]